MMYLHYLCIFGLHNDPFEDCKQWKLLKHVPLSDLNPATERVGWGRGSELFACTVFNLSIYFCLALCFLQSRSHKLFKTPNILKIRFEKKITSICRKNKCIFFWKTEMFCFFSRKIENFSKFSKIWFFGFFGFFGKFSKKIAFSRKKYKKNVFFPKNKILPQN